MPVSFLSSKKAETDFYADAGEISVSMEKNIWYDETG